MADGGFILQHQALDDRGDELLDQVEAQDDLGSNDWRGERIREYHLPQSAAAKKASSHYLSASSRTGSSPSRGSPPASPVGQFAFWVAVSVVAGLILAAILSAIRWLRDPDNRQRLQQRLCRHDWETVEPLHRGPGTRLIFATSYRERCRKCGATR